MLWTFSVPWKSEIIELSFAIVMVFDKEVVLHMLYILLSRIQVTLLQSCIQMAKYKQH